MNLRDVCVALFSRMRARRYPVLNDDKLLSFLLLYAKASTALTRNGLERRLTWVYNKTKKYRTCPNAAAVRNVIILAPGTANVRRWRMSPWRLLLRLRWRLTTVAQVGFPKVSAVVHRGLPWWAAAGGASVQLDGRFRIVRNVPVCVLIDVLLQ